MSPVVVVKDFGGYVNEYASQTEIYRRQNREVRIHECHSACTMALSLPNVCVYKDSIFKFHQAYDPRNHVTNWEVSDALFHTYPGPVRERLGTLTKQFTIMRGAELIDLGVRDCNQGPEPRIMMATATSKPLGDGALAGGGFAALTGKLQGMIPNFGAKPELVPDAGKAARRVPAVPGRGPRAVGPAAAGAALGHDHGFDRRAGPDERDGARRRAATAASPEDPPRLRAEPAADPVHAEDRRVGRRHPAEQVRALRSPGDLNARRFPAFLQMEPVRAGGLDWSRRTEVRGRNRQDDRTLLVRVEREGANLQDAV